MNTMRGFSGKVLTVDLPKVSDIYTFSANVDNLNPGDADILLLNPTATNLSITGILFTTPGRVLILNNINGSNTVTLNPENAQSQQNYRFASPTETIPPGGNVTIRYDMYSHRWKINHPKTESGGPFVRYFQANIAPPTVNDDSADGYRVGDIWIDALAMTAWQALYVGVGAAIWKLLTPSIEISNGIVNRVLQEDTTVPDGHSLVLVDYIDLNGFDLTLEGDAALAIINGDSDNGWIPRTETWTRTGNHTFTVSGDVTTIYRKGTKIRYKDGGSYEYGAVNSSSHSAGTTTITLIANTNYAMAAATITDTYLSYIENPEGYPQEFDFTPSWVNLTLGNGTYTYAKWSCKGTEFTCRVHLVFGTTTSIGGNVDLNAPATSATYASSSSRPPVGYATFLDAGVAAYLGSLAFAGSGIIRVQSIGTAGSFAGIAAITSTTPFTWGSTDELSLEARYLI